MPHLIIEYTETLETSVDIAGLVKALHHTLGEQETIHLSSIKSRAIPVKYAILGAQEEHNKMLHITLRLAPGRGDALRKTIAQNLLGSAREHVQDDDINIRVETVEFHAESYAK